MVFDPKGKRLAYGDGAGNVVVWDLAANRPVQKFETGSTIRSLLYLDRVRSLVTHGKNAVFLFNLESGKLQRKIDLAGGEIRRLVADDGRNRLVVGLESGAVGALSLPDLTPGVRVENGHEGRWSQAHGLGCRNRLFGPEESSVRPEGPFLTAQGEALGWFCPPPIS